MDTSMNIADNNYIVTEEFKEITEEKPVMEDKEKYINRYKKMWFYFGVSILIVITFTIYSEVVILKTCEEFSDKQPTIAILLFILELLSIFVMFFIEIGLIEKTYVDVCGAFICSIIILAMAWVPRGFAYAEVFNYIKDDNYRVHTTDHNYNILKNNLIASTVLHSSSLLFNFIMTILVAYYKNKHNIEETKA
jgi:hypothetical protein